MQELELENQSLRAQIQVLAGLEKDRQTNFGLRHEVFKERTYVELKAKQKAIALENLELRRVHSELIHQNEKLLRDNTRLQDAITHLKGENDSHQIKQTKPRRLASKSRRYSAANAANIGSDLHTKKDANVEDRFAIIETKLREIQSEFDDEVRIVQVLSQAIQEQQHVLRSLCKSEKRKDGQKNWRHFFVRNQISPIKKV